MRLDSPVNVKPTSARCCFRSCFACLEQCCLCLDAALLPAAIREDVPLAVELPAAIL